MFTPDFAEKLREWYKSYENAPSWRDVYALLERELTEQRKELLQAVKNILAEYSHLSAEETKKLIKEMNNI